MRPKYSLGLGILAVGIFLSILLSGCKQTTPTTIPQTISYQVVLNKQCDFESVRNSPVVGQYIDCLNESVPRDIVNSVAYDPKLNVIAGMRPLTDYDLMGKGVKRDIVLGEKFFKDIETNAEAEGVIIHELRHQGDYFYGIRLDNMFLPSSVPSKELTVEFVDTLSEARGYYEEVKFLRASTKKGEKVGDQNMCTVATRYVLHSYRLNQLPKNDIQRKIANSQANLMTDVEWQANFSNTGISPRVTQVELLFEKQDRYWCEWPKSVGLD